MKVMVVGGGGREHAIIKKIKEKDLDSLAAEIRQVNEEMQVMYQKLSFVTEPDLIDAAIFQLNATQKRYEYLVNLCKQKQMVKK